MAIVEMKKISLIALKSDTEKILKVFQALGNVETIETKDEISEEIVKQTISEAKVKRDDQYPDIALLSRALDTLKRYGVKKKPLGYKHALTAGKAKEMERKTEILRDVVSKCQDIEEKLAQIRSGKTRLNNLKAQAEPWVSLDLPVKEVKDTKETKVFLGTVGKEIAEAFERSLDESLYECYYQRLGEMRDEYCYILIYHKAVDNAAAVIFKENGFNKNSFSSFEGTPKEAIDDFTKQIEELDRQSALIEKQAEELFVHIDDLEILYDILTIKHDREAQTEKLLKTRETFVLKGWAPAKDEALIRSKLAKVTDALRIDFEGIGKDEVYPVAFQNHAAVRPFEMITKLYSMPNHTSIDSNIHMAPFFFTFFGIMLGDAAYGLILAVLGAYFTKKLKLKGDGARMGWLISLLGLATFIWGALFGGWFGDGGARIGIAPIWFDPMRNPMLMLGLCFGLGLLQIFVGMAIKAWINIKRGLYLDAIFDQGLWYLLLIGLLLMLTPVSAIGGYMSIAGAIGLVLTQGRSQKSIISKFTTGLLSLYNVSAYLSDVLSYSRLFALGLATAVIGMVFNQLGAMLGASWITFVFAIIILAVGHVFNIAVSALGAYVHSSRLQYIEFFGKFFEGGGRAFRPLGIKTKFTEILEEEAI